MASYSIGESPDGHRIDIDLDLLIATRLLVQASSGQGKTRTIRRLLEQTHGHVQHLVLDPEGEYHSLREKFDYILAAPTGGDVVAHPKYAAKLAHELLRLGVSAILDIYELDPDDRVAFVANFVAALVNAPRELWHPCLIVLDEAHTFCPEGSKSESARAIEALASKGRKRGYCLIAATQRIAKFKKDAAAELGNKLIGGCNLDVDIDRAGEELGIPRAKRADTLRGIPPGTFYAYGRAFGVVQPVRIKVGDVITTHAEPGAAPVPVPPPTAKVLRALAHLVNLPAKVEEEAETLEGLREEVARLRNAAPAPVEVETRDVPVMLDGEISRLINATEKIKEEKESLVDSIGKLLGAFASDFDETLARVERKIDYAGCRPTIVSNASDPDDVTVLSGGMCYRLDPPILRPVDTAPKRHAPIRVTGPTPTGVLGGPELRILESLAWFRALGIRSPFTTAVAFMANYKPGGGAFMNPRGRLHKMGLISYGGDTMSLTEAGVATAPRCELPRTNEALHKAVMARLDGPEAKILDQLIRVYPRTLSDPDLAARTNYATGGGAFNNPKGRLRRLGLITYPDKKHSRAADLLFPQKR